MKKTIYLADYHSRGHHYRYLAAIEKAFVQLGCNVHVLCENRCEYRSQFDLNLTKKTDRKLQVHSFTASDRSFRFPIGRFNVLVNRFLLWRQTFNRIKTIEKMTGQPADMVFLPWLDSYIKNYYNNVQLNRYLPILLKSVVHRPWSGIYFHPRYLRLPTKYPMLQEPGVSRKALFTKTNCRALFTLDEGIKDRLASEVAPVQTVWLPDVLPNPQTDMNWPPLQQIQKEAGNRPVILLSGMLNRYKGVLEFIKLAESCGHKQWLFVMAGKLDEQSFQPRILEKIKKAAIPNLLTIFEHIPTEQHINGLLALSSVIYCCYPGFTHSSSIQLRGVQFGKKMVVVNEHLMKERCQKLPNCYHFKDTDSITPDSLEAVISSPLKKEATKARDEFLSQYRFSHFKRQLGTCLRI